MQAGCKQDASNLNDHGVPTALLRSWSKVPEHIRLAILALVEPYHEGAG